MPEGKEGKEDDAELISFHNIRFLDGCDVGELTAPLKFEIRCSTSRKLEDSRWEVKYLVDSVRKRFIIILGKTELKHYDEDCSLSFAVPSVDVSSVKPGHLTNAGLLVCTLFSGEDEIADVKMVVQVSRDERSGEFMRQIFNPLE